MLVNNNASIAYGHVKRISFTKLTHVAAKGTSTSQSNSNTMQAERRTLLGKRRAPTASTPAASQQPPTSSILQTTPTQRTNAYIADRFSGTSMNGMWLWDSNSTVVSTNKILDTETTDTVSAGTSEANEQDSGAPSTPRTTSGAELSIIHVDDLPSVGPSVSPDEHVPAAKRRRTGKS